MQEYISIKNEIIISKKKKLNKYKSLSWVLIINLTSSVYKVYKEKRVKREEDILNTELLITSNINFLYLYCMYDCSTLYLLSLTWDRLLSDFSNIYWMFSSNWTLYWEVLFAVLFNHLLIILLLEYY